MRQITKDITLKQDGQDLSFRLSRLDAFSGVSLLRLLMRLEDREGEHTHSGPGDLPSGSVTRRFFTRVRLSDQSDSPDRAALSE